MNFMRGLWLFDQTLSPLDLVLLEAPSGKPRRGLDQVVVVASLCLKPGRPACFAYWAAIEVDPDVRPSPGVS